MQAHADADVMWFNSRMARREFFYGYRTPVLMRG
jgi:hypothetical protein